MRRSTAVVAAAGLVCCVLPGCSANGGGTNLPRVSRTALQQDIAHRLALLDLPRVTGAPLTELVVRKPSP